jgi:hypothetical protein
VDGATKTYLKMIRIGENATQIGLKLVAGDRGKVVLPKLLKKTQKIAKNENAEFLSVRSPFAPKVEYITRG